MRREHLSFTRREFATALAAVPIAALPQREGSYRVDFDDMSWRLAGMRKSLETMRRLIA